jgi:DNA-directed RNA polymerase specialized sigma24 family protein
MDKFDTKIFIDGLSEDELVAFVEAARLGLSDERIAENLSLSEPDINNLYNKVYRLLTDTLY